jgi:alpha-D-ribose 1-methylphosphonate 5-phosphate C-P lyase
VTAGEALGVIGESGSGKSTVMRCVAGDQTATKGSAHIRTVDGGESDVMGLDPSRRRSLRSTNSQWSIRIPRRA